MGQAKYNPTAIAAKKGKLPSKPKKLGKREFERLMYNQMTTVLLEKYSNIYESEKMKGVL